MSLSCPCISHLHLQKGCCATSAINLHSLYFAYFYCKLTAQPGFFPPDVPILSDFPCYIYRKVCRHVMLHKAFSYVQELVLV